jgi:hypothetical protein
MTAVKHPIVLQTILFTRCVVLAMPGHEPKDGQLTIEPDNKLNVSPVPEQKGTWSATMRSVLNAAQDNHLPYSIDMECMALLHADETLTETEAARGVTITAHSVLYGAIRETVAWLTGRQPYGPLMLGLSVLQTAKKEPDAKS